MSVTDIRAMRESWEQAYHWVCLRRKQAPFNADIWDLRFHWSAINEDLFNAVIAGQYRLSPMLVVGRGKERLPQWSARDALVLKFAALCCSSMLPVSHLCGHVRTHGGIYRSVKRVAALFNSMTFVYRTDIRGFYENIQKPHIISLINEYVTEPGIADIIRQYVYYSVEDAGIIRTPVKGICRGCALSPVVGASILWHADVHFEKQIRDDFFYARYMDDFLLMSRTRWPVRRGIKYLNTVFEQDGYVRHPDKTQIGKTERGFDWLGIWFSPAGHTISPRSLENHRQRKLSLTERLSRRGYLPSQISQHIHNYETRWTQWSRRLMENL